MIKTKEAIETCSKVFKNTYSTEFEKKFMKSIEELVEMAQKPFTKAEDLHELSKQQCDLFEIESDCFCKAS